jgi:hypothetical protein
MRLILKTLINYTDGENVGSSNEEMCDKPTKKKKEDSFPPSPPHYHSIFSLAKY